MRRQALFPPSVPDRVLRDVLRPAWAFPAEGHPGWRPIKEEKSACSSSPPAPIARDARSLSPAEAAGAAAPRAGRSAGILTSRIYLFLLFRPRNYTSRLSH